jgi:hypothetical protein
MKRIVITRIGLIADEGHKLTDGKDIVDTHFLAEGSDESVWREITDEEAEKIQAEKEEALPE